MTTVTPLPLFRRVSYGAVELPENVTLKKDDSDDSGCDADESFEVGNLTLLGRDTGEILVNRGFEREITK